MSVHDSNATFSRRLRSSIGGIKRNIFGGCIFSKWGRSRRKAEVNNKENRPCTSKKTGPSLSQASASKVRRAPQSELCVADSFDDAMLDKITSKPYGIDKNEWLATHTLALFDNVNALCGSVSELCTPANCGTMSYPGVSKAYFIDEKGKRHLYSASQYVDCVMSFCERSRKNEEIFPTKFGSTFLPDFDQHCRRMIRYLWHCCGHLYSKHWDQLAALNLRPQCGLVLAHIQRIAKDFGLLDSKELAILSKTLSLVRPPHVNEPPAKRIGGVDDQLSGSGADSVSGIRWNGVPAAKSGSWGGHPTPTVLSCKHYAQTC
uniref:MOB kinase activator-like 2 n=1 Tax=Panagrellus redivivus TaxID=6233 RepID=A0A7E4W9G2_PANRE